MSKERFDPQKPTPDHSLCDLNLLSLWWVSGSDWSLTIKRECFATLNQSDEKKAIYSQKKVVFVEILVTIVLLMSAIWVRGLPVNQVGQEVKTQVSSQLKAEE